MKIELKKNLATGIALLLAIATLVSGISVISGRGPSDQIVLLWLVWYNVIFAIFSLAVAYGIWRATAWSNRGAFLIFSGHFTVLLILVGIYFITGNVAGKSIGAMAFRTVAWSLILLLKNK